MGAFNRGGAYNRDSTVFCNNPIPSQPHSQGSLLPTYGVRERDRGLVWSCVSRTKLILKEESFVFHCHCQIEAIAIALWSKFSAMFYSSLHVAIIPITQTNYSNINLRPKRVKCLEATSCGRDVVAILPMGYGKSRIVHVLPSLLHKKIKSGWPAPSPSFCPIIIVVSPLNALIKDQIRRSNDGQVKATFLNSKRRGNSGN